MATQTIVWTCLPNGIDKSVSPNVLNLSIFITPRLTAGASNTLADYSQFVDWPATLAAMGKISIKIGASAPVLVNLPTFNSALWKAIFPSTTFVRQWIFEDQSPNYVFSYPVSNIANTIRSFYQNVAVNSPTSPPTKVDLQQRFPIGDMIPQNPPDNRQFYQVPLSLPYGVLYERSLLSLRDQKNKFFPPSFDSYTGNLNGYVIYNQQQYDLFQMQVFHQPRTHTVADPATGYPMATLGALPAAGDFQNILDFHQRVSAIGKYPALMRELGLVIDLKIPATGLSIAGSTINAVLSAPNFTPFTVLSAAGDFRAAINGATGDLQPGYLDLTAKSNHELVEFDVDGAALKMISLAAGLAQARVYSTEDTPSSAALASLRSGGLTLIRRNRAQLLSSVFQNSKTNNTNLASKNTHLYAEDLVRGYRVDVSDNIDPKWHSLFQRIGKYLVVANPALSASAIPDEGFTQLAATSPSNPTAATKDLYLHESLLRWDGWSLAAPRPGNTITDAAEPVGNDAAPGMGLSATFTVPAKTLPKLRYGRSYRFRARSVDMAGNSLPPTDAIATYATPLKFYARFEPVVAPAIVLRVPPGTGESLTEVVIRSYNATPAMDTVATNETSDRHIVPPRVAEEIAETHGMFDNGPGLRTDVFNLIAQNDANYAIVKVGPATSPSLFPYYPAPQAKIPYLPDPMSAGATFQYLPGLGPTVVKQYPFTDVGTWPDVTPFRLQLIEGTWGYSYDSTNRILTISLPKGGTTTVYMMSTLPQLAPGGAFGASPPAALELLGVWKLMEAAAPSNLSTLKGLAVQSRLWMLTPPRAINLTHAVQQPLILPTFVTVTPQKFLGATYAQFLGSIKADGQTTSQLDFDATWTEPYDNPDDPLSLHPDTDRFNAHSAAFQLQLRFPGPLMGPFAVASPTTINDDSGRILGTYNISTKTLTFGLITPQAGPLNLPRHEFGDTKYRRVTYTPIGTSRYREFYTLPITAVNNPYTRQQAVPTVLDIPNSARPLAPQILYAIPTFRHQTTAKSAKRLGGGLRIYMDRPWFSSGDGELLGAVLWNPTYSVIRGTTTQVQNTLPDKFKPYVTQWGADPAYAAPAPQVVPAMSYFTNKAITTGFNTTTLTLDELPGETVSVAAHNVGFDADRNLWYCDIDIAPQNFYMPFVRLALARYQPHSITGAHLSRVVLTEFVQLTPDRAAAIVGQANSILISVTGYSYTSAVSYVDSAFAGPGVVVASLEYETTNDPAGDAAWVPLPQYEVKLTAKVGTNGLVVWSGKLLLPAVQSGSQFRVVIREYELVNASATALPPYLPETSFELGYRRLLFAEAIDVTAFIPVT